MEAKQLQHKKSFINYYIYGNGPGIVLCFHGYGETARMFEFLAKYSGDLYTFYSIDLPFHGETKWNEGLNFTLNDLTQIVRKIIVNNDKKFSLMGFSLGCRVCLSLFQQMPERIEKIILLAPDGLKMNRWYWLATQTHWGNKLFLFTINRPALFFGILKLMNKLKLVNLSIYKFVSFYIGDKEVRNLLYTRWTTLRKIRPGIKIIKSFIRKHKTPVRLIYGNHDRIILSSVGEKFKKGIEDYCTLSIIHSGHQVLHEKHVEEILPALLQ